MEQPHSAGGDYNDSDRRFLYRLAGLVVATGLAFAAWPFIDSMNPSAETLNPLVFVDLRRIPPGERKTIKWRRFPIHIVHRTPEQIAAVRADDMVEMPFPQADHERVQRDEWLVVIAACWFGTRSQSRWLEHVRGPWGGWYCPVRYDPQYDLSGRLRSRWGGEGNMKIPPYYFDGDDWLVIGEAS